MRFCCFNRPKIKRTKKKYEELNTQFCVRRAMLIQENKIWARMASDSTGIYAIPFPFPYTP